LIVLDNFRVRRVLFRHDLPKGKKLPREKGQRALAEARLPFGAKRLEGQVAAAPIRCEGRRGKNKKAGALPRRLLEAP